MGMINGADEERFEHLRYVEIKHSMDVFLCLLSWDRL